MRVNLQHPRLHLDPLSGPSLCSTKNHNSWPHWPHVCRALWSPTTFNPSKKPTSPDRTSSCHQACLLSLCVDNTEGRQENLARNKIRISPACKLGRPSKLDTPVMMPVTWKVSRCLSMSYLYLRLLGTGDWANHIPQENHIMTTLEET